MTQATLSIPGLPQVPLRHEHTPGETDDGVRFDTYAILNEAGVPVLLVTRQADGTITVTDDEGHSLA